MSYIENRRSIEDYLNSIKEKSKRNHIGSILNQFDIFCKQSFNKTHQQVIDDIKVEITKTNSNDKIYVIFNKYKDWLSEDHPEITYFTGKYSKHKNTIKKRHPNSIKQYISKMRNIFEEVGNIEINNRIFNKRVRIVKAEEEDPEPFTKEQMRILLDRCSNHNKLKYMVLKDSGMRVGELTQIRKRDINTTKTPIEIKIQASYTKTRKARITFVTRETAPMLIRLLREKQEDELVFGTNEDPYIATGTEKAEFTYYREQLAKTYPEFGERYQSNQRHKKTIHSIRSYTSTQCAEAIDEAWGHSVIGHSKYLGQYIRNQDKRAQMYLKSESYLMIYEKEVIIEHDEEVNNIQAQLNKQGLLIQELLSINDEKTSLLKRNSNLQKRITELELKIRP
ncbi:MAG: site-specific integrase [Crenarchaeota archaeon]|nr:site-specific integrase [Thermoproteota archaeon]